MIATAPDKGGIITPRRALLRSLRGQEIVLGFALLAPVVLLRLFTVVYPFLRTVYLSLFDNSPIRRTFDYVGLDNYLAMTRDSTARNGLEFTLFFTVVSVSIQVVLALAVAQLLNQRSAVSNLTRAVNLMPWAMPAVVTALAARFIFHPEYGLFNDLLWRVGGERLNWLSSPSLARFAVILTDVWKHTPFLAVMFLSGLQGISEELYDAAKIDGADRWRAYRYVTLPLLAPLIGSMTIFVAIFRLLSFEIVYALTSGGPGTATSLLSYLVYREAFSTLNFGYGATLATTLFLIVLAMGLVGLTLLRRAWAKT